MTTAAVGNSGEKEKEKAGMRRALGRGLASLLPGPRVVSATPAAAPPPTAATSAGTAPAAVQSSAPAASAPGSAAGSSIPAGSPAGAGVRAELETRPGAAAPHLSGAGPQVAAVSAVSPRVETRVDGNTVRVIDHETTSPADAGGQPGAAVSTYEPGVEIALVDESAVDGPIELQAAAETRIPGSLVVSVAIADIDKNPYQTRHVEDDDTLDELAESIKAHGVVQPIVVRPSEEEGRYTLILGERRMLASKKAGKTHIPAMVRRVAPQQAAEMTIIENLQREDLSPLEQAQSFKVLSTEFNLTQEEIGKRVGLSRVSIANYMRLLKLPREVMELLAQKSLTFAEAKELLALENADQIAQAAVYAVKKGMTAEQIEKMVLSMNGLLEPFPGMPGQAKKKSGARWVDPNVRAAQVDLERTLGLRVRIRDRKGKGKIVIEYATVDDYERVVEMLRGK
jgi:ParB family chromosome partitioning protein